jgi:hypothetical protein
MKAAKLRESAASGAHPAFDRLEKRMLRSFLASLLLIALLPFASLAEDSQLHWYRIVVSAGNEEVSRGPCMLAFSSPASGGN